MKSSLRLDERVGWASKALLISSLNSCARVLLSPKKLSHVNLPRQHHDRSSLNRGRRSSLSGECRVRGGVHLTSLVGFRHNKQKTIKKKKPTLVTFPTDPTSDTTVAGWKNGERKGIYKRENLTPDTTVAGPTIGRNRI